MIYGRVSSFFYGHDINCYGVWQKAILFFNSCQFRHQFMSVQMAQFMENIGVLIDYNGNPITLLDLSVRCINCECGRGSEHRRSVNEGLWLAFVETQWSSYVLKVRPPLWHEKMKTLYFLGNVMIWIKIVRLAVSSYHSAGVLYDLFKELSFSAPAMPLKPSFLTM